MKSKKTLIGILTLAALFLVAGSTLLPLGSVSKALATAIYGNATAADILSGQTATVDAGQITGTMPNKVGSATLITPSPTSEQAIPQGYYGGNLTDGKVAKGYAIGSTVLFSNTGLGTNISKYPRSNINTSTTGQSGMRSGYMVKSGTYLVFLYYLSNSLINLCNSAGTLYNDNYGITIPINDMLTADNNYVYCGGWSVSYITLYIYPNYLGSQSIYQTTWTGTSAVQFISKGDDGYIYMGVANSSAGGVLKFGSGGTYISTINIGSVMNGGSVGYVDSSGNIYILLPTGVLKKYNSSGVLQSSLTIHSNAHGRNLAIKGSGGYLYIADSSGYVTEVNISTMSIVWTTLCSSSNIITHLDITSDGYILGYSNYNGGYLYILDTNGNLLGTVTNDASAPTIADMCSNGDISAYSSFGQFGANYYYPSFDNRSLGTKINS